MSSGYREHIDELVASVLGSTAPDPRFAASLLAGLRAAGSEPLVVLPPDGPARRGWLVVGTVAGATAAGIAVLSWRLTRRGAA